MGDTFFRLDSKDHSVLLVCLGSLNTGPVLLELKDQSYVEERMKVEERIKCTSLLVTEASRTAIKTNKKYKVPFILLMQCPSCYAVDSDEYSSVQTFDRCSLYYSI